MIAYGGDGHSYWSREPVGLKGFAHLIINVEDKNDNQPVLLTKSLVVPEGMGGRSVQKDLSNLG